MKCGWRVSLVPSLYSRIWQEKSKNMQNKNLSFLFLSSYTGFLCFVRSILHGIVWENKLVLTRASLIEALTFWHLVYYQRVYAAFKEDMKRLRFSF